MAHGSSQNLHNCRKFFYFQYPMPYLYFLIAFILSFASPVAAQLQPPAFGPVYTHSEIPRVYISIDPDSLDALYVEENDNWYSNHEYPATFVFTTASGSDTVPEVGFRFRGNTSRHKVKKSFKVSFNTFVPGRKYFGVEKINLNAEANDPSMLRSRLCWDMYRNAGITASRSNHVELYINGDYFGLYQNIEHIDEEFADTWFGSKKGNLYKCSYPANLHYISNNPDDYKMAPYGFRTYELKTNEAVDDYTYLAEFIAFLNQSNATDYRCRIADYFDVYSYLKVAAIDVLTGNWDGYIYNQNNYYLYENPLTDRIHYIPYDADNTWGIDWFWQDWTNRYIYNWSHESRPLYDRLMDEPVFRNIFSWHIQHLLNTTFNTTEHREGVENLQAFIQASALADPYRPLDYGFSEYDFLNALTDSSADHVPYGVFTYADLRESSAQNQLESISIAPVISTIKVDFAEAPGLLTITAFVDGPETQSANLAYQINGVQQVSISGLVAQEYIAFEIPLSENSIDFTYNITATGANGFVRHAFCSPRTITFSPAQEGIVINEIMASNQTGITDENGGTPDWIELYNAGGVAVNLNDFYLSDADEAPFKWNLPDITMDPGDFLLLYADGSIEEGPLHTNFKVRASGDNIYLFERDETHVTMVDKVEMPAMNSDYSYGRALDGGMPWVVFSDPTPDASNEESTSINEWRAEAISVYPNPTSGLLYFSKRADYTLRDLLGRKLISGNGKSLNLEKFAKGSYLLSIDGKTLIIQHN